MSEWRIPLFAPDFGAAEAEAILRPLRAGWLTMGDETRLLEEDLCRLLGARHAIAVSNCTAALHLACLALGLGPGDEVLCPTLTFVATANAPRAVGASVRFCPSIGPNDLTVDPATLARLQTPRTRAAMLVHYAGFPCRLGEITAWAERTGVALIEDCAHALVTTVGGKALGRHGRVGCFSFFSNKNATCGEGGALVTDDDDLAARLRLLRSHGMTTATLDRHRGRAFSYDVVCPGFNYRLDEIRAALLRTQLARLPEFLARRHEIFLHYANRFRDTPVAVPFARTYSPRELESVGVHIMAVLLPEGTDRLAVMTHLKQAGIQSSIHYPPVHRFTAYQGDHAGLEATEALAARELTLPFYPTMTPADVDCVADALLVAISDTSRSTPRPPRSKPTAEAQAAGASFLHSNAE